MEFLSFLFFFSFFSFSFLICLLPPTRAPPRLSSPSARCSLSPPTPSVSSLRLPSACPLRCHPPPISRWHPVAVAIPIFESSRPHLSICLLLSLCLPLSLCSIFFSRQPCLKPPPPPPPPFLIRWPPSNSSHIKHLYIAKFLPQLLNPSFLRPSRRHRRAYHVALGLRRHAASALPHLH